MADEDIAIKAEHVSKDFQLPHEKISSVKNVFVHAFRNIQNKRSFGVQHALKDVSFEVKKGEFFGIVGRNGSGKSTLLKLLAGIYQPTKGSIYKSGRLVPFIELGVGFNPELTGRQNVYLNGALLGFSEKEVDRMYDEIVAFAELEDFMDQKLKNYSSGMQVRLAFSTAIRAEAEILLIDEVLAVGDADFQRKCYEYFKKLKKDKTTVIFVTHDMGAVREFCDRAMLIDDHEVQYLGRPTDVATEYLKLFAKPDQSINDEATEGKRWGNGDINFVHIDVQMNKTKVLINAHADVRRQVDKTLFGLHIVGPDGVEVTAMNNRMLKLPDVENVKPGDSIAFSWEILNIFNEGKYRLDLTLVDDEGTALDWYTGAKSFTVHREERSTTAVLPPVTLKVKRS